MNWCKVGAKLLGWRCESCNLATLTLSITSTVRRPNFQTPVLSQGATIWANVSDMVNLESVEHPQQHFMKIIFFHFALLFLILQHCAPMRNSSHGEANSCFSPHPSILSSTDHSGMIQSGQVFQSKAITLRA